MGLAPYFPSILPRKVLVCSIHFPLSLTTGTAFSWYPFSLMIDVTATLTCIVLVDLGIQGGVEIF